MGSIIRLGLIEPAARSLIAGVASTVLSDIGGRTLAAEVSRAIIVGEGAGLQAGTVIVEVADLVGQSRVVVVAVVPVVAGIRQAGGQGHGGQEGRTNPKLRCFHLDSPEIALKLAIFGRFGFAVYANWLEKLRKTAQPVPISPKGCLTNSQHSLARILLSCPELTAPFIRT